MSLNMLMKKKFLLKIKQRLRGRENRTFTAGDIWRLYDQNLDKRNLVVVWEFSNWCNYNCSYCYEPNHDKKAGHAFEYYDVETWSSAFKKFDTGLRKIHLVIVGGESFLDVKNMYIMLENLTQMDFIDSIRIDTNGSINPDLYKGIDLSKIFLNMSFHPEMINLTDFTRNLTKYLERGFNVQMINFQIINNNEEEYEKIKTFFWENYKIKVNPALTILDSPVFYNLKWFSKHLSEEDLQFRARFNTSTYGLKCRYPMINYSIYWNGTVVNSCFDKKKYNLITVKKNKLNSLLKREIPNCPRVFCWCLHMYSFIEGFKRNEKSLNLLKNYTEQAIK